jgi:hypothetical protein
MKSNLYPLTNHRRLRKHRDLTLLLDILLAGGIKSMDDLRIVGPEQNGFSKGFLPR